VKEKNFFFAETAVKSNKQEQGPCILKHTPNGGFRHQRATSTEIAVRT